MNDRQRILGIDSLRFVSFLSVFITHATPYWKLGSLGMDFFFVLSSFLLTYLALKEIKETNDFSKTNFFIRRGLRIYPLYYFILIFAFFILPLVAKQFGETVSLPSRKYLYFFFLSNFDFTDHIFALKFLWSISVEEQFYVIFIFLTYFFKRNIFLPIIGLFTVFIISTAICLHYDWFQYTNTFFYFPHFAAGMLAAKLYFDNKFITKIRLLILIAVLFIVTFLFFYCPMIYDYRNLALSLLLGSTLLGCIFILKDGSNNHILLNLTEYFGKYTYGLYVYSGFVITLVIKELINYSIISKVVIELTLLIIIAILSFNYFEKKFLSLKKMFR